VKRTILTILLALLGSVFIWIVAPYNNFIVANGFVADDYMPAIGVFVMLVFVVGVNSFLRRLAPSFALGYKHLAVLFSIILVACLTPTSGLLRNWLYPIATSGVRVCADQKLAQAYKEAGVRESLFPDKLEYETEPKACKGFFTRLAEGEEIPWGAWLAPLVSWSGYLVPWLLMSVAMAMILLPHWRDHERQPFPLLVIYNSLIAEPTPGRRLPPIMYDKFFWVAAGAVLIIHSINETSLYLPSSVPRFPIEWNLRRCFTEGMWRLLPFWIYSSRIYFLFAGIAFFMPTRIGFSIWSFTIIYGLFGAVAGHYFPPFSWKTVENHRLGAFVMFALVALWLSRRYLLHVLKCMFRPAEGDSDRRYRFAGYLMLGSLLAMFGWFVWARLNVVWAAGLVIVSFLWAVSLARIVAETGIPLVQADSSYVVTLSRLVPPGLRSGIAMWVSGIVSHFVGYGARVSGSVVVMHALGMDKDSGPKKHVRLALLFIAVIVVSILVTGAVQLYFGYHHEMSLGGRFRPVEPWGSDQFKLGNNNLLAFDKTNEQAMTDVGQLAFGACLALVLCWLSASSPKWPFHPVGLVLAGLYSCYTIWMSVFIGWLLKVLILRYGGSRGFRRSQNFFIGLALGEVFAVILWCGIATMRGMLGLEYHEVLILPW